MESRMRSPEEQRLIDARIAEIKKKEQLIKKRQQEIEEDKRMAEEQNAVVNLKPAINDWLPEKTPPLKPSSRVSFGEVEEMNPNTKQMPYRGRGRGRRYEDQKVGGPPPDPISFLADPERDYHPPEVNTNHYQPRNNRQEISHRQEVSHRQEIPHRQEVPHRQEASPKSFNENWRSEEKWSPPKAGKAELDWRGERRKNVDGNWREEIANDLNRDDRGSSVKSVSMQKDWRKMQAPLQERSIHQTSSSHEGQFVEGDCFEESNAQIRSNAQYLSSSNENVRDPNDLRNKLMSKNTEPRGQSNFTDEDLWNSRETAYNSSSNIPPQNIPEPLRQTAFDTLPTQLNSENPNSQRVYENDPHSMQNSVYYSNSKSISEYESVRRATETNHVYHGESEDQWEGDEKCFVNQSKINYGHDPLRAEYTDEENDAWNAYYQDCSEGSITGSHYSSSQRYAEPPKPANTGSQYSSSQRYAEPSKQDCPQAANTSSHYSSGHRYADLPEQDCPQAANTGSQYSTGERYAEPPNQDRSQYPSGQRYAEPPKAANAGSQYSTGQRYSEPPNEDGSQYSSGQRYAELPKQDFSQAVNTGSHYSSGQRYTEIPMPQAPDRGVKPPSFITNNGQSWNETEPPRTISHDSEQNAPVSYQTSQSVFLAGNHWNEPKPSTQYSNESKYEQALLDQMRLHASKPPNPVYPTNYDRQTSLNQQTLMANSGNLRQSSALNAGRPDEAYAYFQAKMAKGHHVSNSSEIDELPAQFAKMYQSAPSDRRMTTAANQNSQGSNHLQFAEMNNANRQQASYPTEAKQWNQVPENIAMPPMHNQPKSLINDRLRRSQEQALMASQHAINSQAISERQAQIEYLQSEARRGGDRFSEHDSYANHSMRKGAEVSCQTEEPLLYQNYSSQIEARQSSNRSHPTSMPPDNYVMSNNLGSAPDGYLNQYESPQAQINPQLNQYQNSGSIESRNIPRQSVTQHLPVSQGQNWTAPNLTGVRHGEHAAQQSQASNPNWNDQPQCVAHINEQVQRNVPRSVDRESSEIDNESLEAYTNELVVHATNRIQARVNSALNDRLKRVRDAALQERFEPSPQFSSNQIPDAGAVPTPVSDPRPVGRAIKGCSLVSTAGKNQSLKLAQSSQFDNWQDSPTDLGCNINDTNASPPLESKPGVSQQDSAEFHLLQDHQQEEPANPIEITLPTCIDLTKPPPVLFPSAAVSPGPTEKFSEEITANIFSSPPPVILELNPDSEDVDNLIAKPYYQYKSPTNHDFRPKLTFSLEKKGLEKTENQSPTVAASSTLSMTQKDRSSKKDEEFFKSEMTSSKNGKSFQLNEERVVEKRISAAERVAKLLETPVVLPDHTPQYVLKVLGEEEIRNIKSRTANNSRNAQNVGS